MISSSAETIHGDDDGDDNTDVRGGDVIVL